MIEGGCFCGNIRFAIDEKIAGKPLVANCHCTMCRKTSAAPFVTWIVIPRTAFSYQRGSAKILQSSDKGTRYFCPDCGTPMAFHTSDRPDNIDITTGSLDDPNRFIPTVNVHEESRLGWVHL